MHHVRNSRTFSGLNAGVIGKVALFLTAFLFLHPFDAKSSGIITNLAQISPALTLENPLFADLEYDATVFTCDTNTGVLILQNSTDAELLEIDGLNDHFEPGDVIHIEGQRCRLSAGDVGIFVTVPPFLDDDGVHGRILVHREHYFSAGRHPLRLDWFNQSFGADLDVSASFAESNTNTQTTEVSATNLLHTLRASCFQGSWSRLPNFQILDPVKTGAVTNFDLGFRTREEMVGIRFDGYFDAPQAGRYRFDLASDDGSRLWIDATPVTIKKIGSSNAPRARPLRIAQPMDNLHEHPLVTVEGRPSFVSRFGKGLKIELRSGQNSVSAIMIDSGTLKSTDLLNAFVRVSGIATCVLGDDQMIRLGAVTLVNTNDLTIVEPSFYRGKNPPTLTTVMQVHSLTRDEAASKVPARIRGTVTTAAPFINHWMILQDDTRGIFVNLMDVPDCRPNIGEYWDVSGYTQPGDFSPVIIAQQAVLLGKSKMPEPAHPSWSQLANGSMDVQWVELQGLVTSVHSNHFSVVTADGPLEVSMANWSESELTPFERAIISIRGTLVAAWIAETHEAHVANFAIFNGSVMVDAPPPTDPFNAPEKSIRGLLRFDPDATP